MSDDSRPMALPPFPPEYRASGVLLHVTSLPSPYGIGDVGPAALKWIDQLHDAGQSWWQALPLGPTGYGNSPYQSLSSFAGNGLLISPGWLIEDGLLGATDCTAPSFSATAVDYGMVITFKRRLLERAWINFSSAARAELRVGFEQFCHDQGHWLKDYALFRVLKAKYNGAYYLEWPAEFVKRVPAALAQARRDLANQIDQVCFAQFLLFRQGERLKKHARAKGVHLIGDLPFFVSPDSSDVWGNPVYNWDVLRWTGYRWCIDRFRALLAHVDVVRLDHFRGFAAAWHVPAGASTAQSGQWVPGPGADFFNAIQRELGVLPFIAEDLGLITPDVSALRDQFQVPGTRVLQFAFDGHSDNPYLPHNYVPNTVVYIGTHDNPTSRGCYEELPPYQRQNLWRYLKSPEGESGQVARDLIRLAWSSSAALAVAPLQDLLNLGPEARMNVPGRAEGNWSWRCTEQMLSAADFHSLRELTRSSNRTGLRSPSEMAEAAS